MKDRAREGKGDRAAPDATPPSSHREDAEAILNDASSDDTTPLFGPRTASRSGNTPSRQEGTASGSAPPANEQSTSEPLASAQPATAEAPSVFAIGQLVADRFRIVRLLGAGGMGEVYEAQDLELGGAVALKTVRPGVALEPVALERFRREINLARRVTHPNVCRIFDVFYHRTAEHSPAAPPVVLLSMEMLRGQTLAAYLEARGGRLSTAEALPIVRQLVAGLEAAHQVGIVHRDLKPSNVILETSESGLRAVITDFGLARGTADDSSAFGQSSHNGPILGSPAYMAPEQLSGRAVGTAADVYALGVVIFEMVTGSRPFAGRTPLETATKRLEEPPPPPRERLPSLPRRWQNVILACLEREPEDRLAPIGVVLERLAPEQSRHVASRRGRRRLLLAALLLLLALLFVLLPRFVPQQQEADTSGVAPIRAAAQQRWSVAVLGFRNLSGRAEVDWLSTAFAEMLATELALGDDLRTLPGETVARARLELELEGRDSLNSEKLAQLRTRLGVDFVVLGAYLALGDGASGPIRIDLRLADAARGETMDVLTETGQGEALFTLVDQVGERLRQALGLGVRSAADTEVLRASLPSSSDAARLYAEGLQALRLFDAQKARHRLVAAADADADNPLIHSALAATWKALGYDARAAASARRAFDLADGLGRADRLAVEGRYYETTHDWPRAIEIYQALWAFFPDTMAYGLRLAAVQTAAGEAQGALDTVALLRMLPPPHSQDPRIDLAAAAALASLSDFRGQQAAAAQAAAKGTAQEARLLVAAARLAESEAWRNLSELDAARLAGEEARQIFDAAGDRRGVARAVRHLGAIDFRAGDLQAARARFEEALSTYRAIGDRRGAAEALNGLAGALFREKDLAVAQQRFTEALAIFTDIDDRESEAKVLNNLANVYKDQGALEKAVELYEASLAIKRDIGNRGGAAYSLSNLGEVLAQRGDLAGASARFEEARILFEEVGDRAALVTVLSGLAAVRAEGGELAVARQLYEKADALAVSLGDPRSRAFTLFGLGALQARAGERVAARENHALARAIRADIGDARRVEESRLALAALSRDEGDATAAAETARDVAEAARRLEVPTLEAQALTELAAALVDQGGRPAARAVVTRARALGPPADRKAALQLAIVAAIAASDPQEAAQRLALVAAEASGAGFVELALEAEFGRAAREYERDPVEGRARLVSLEEEARVHGFGRLADRAASFQDLP